MISLNIRTAIVLIFIPVGTVAELSRAAENLPIEQSAGATPASNATMINDRSGPSTKQSAEQDMVAALQKTGAHVTLDDDGHVKSLVISTARANEAELALLKHLPQLERLTIGRVVFTNPPKKTIMREAALAHLRDVKTLKRLGLPRDITTDDTMKHLKGMTQLEFLDLGETQISDRALMHLNGMVKLRWLGVNSTAISDTGLSCLQKLPELRSVDARRTQVTEVGREALRKHIPAINVKLD